MEPDKLFADVERFEESAAETVGTGAN
jgi:hypothetical protein